MLFNIYLVSNGQYHTYLGFYETNILCKKWKEMMNVNHFLHVS